MTAETLAKKLLQGIADGVIGATDRVSFHDGGREYEVDYLLHPREASKLVYSHGPIKRVQLCWDDGTH